MGYCLKIGRSNLSYKDFISIMQMNIVVSELGGGRGTGWDKAVAKGSFSLLPNQVHGHSKSQRVSTPCTNRLSPHLSCG